MGSCFNPFLKFDEFITVGIDIVPAVEVRVCLKSFLLTWWHLKGFPVCWLSAGITEWKNRSWNGSSVCSVVKQIQQKAKWSLLCNYKSTDFHGWIDSVPSVKTDKFDSIFLFVCLFFPFLECLQVWLPQPSASAAPSACRWCSGGLPAPAPQPHRLPARPAFPRGGLLPASILLSLTVPALDLL